VNEDLDYFMIQPPAITTAEKFRDHQKQPQDNRLFSDRPKSHAQDTPTNLKKMLRKLEASVARNSFVGAPSKHARKNLLGKQVK
jgi:hypothetical protein